MLRLIFTTALITLFNLNFAAERNADGKKYKEVKRTITSEVFNVSADSLWYIVGTRFDDAYMWSTAIDHSVGVGDGQFQGANCDARACDVSSKGFSKIEERLTKYDIQNKILAFDVVSGTPGFVLYAHNEWHIVPVGPNQCKIEMTLVMHLKPFMGSIMGGMFRKNVQGTIDGLMRDLKSYAETGEVSAEKKARMEELAEIKAKEEKKNNKKKA